MINFEGYLLTKLSPPESGTIVYTNDPALPDSPDRPDLAGGAKAGGASNCQSGVCHLDKDQSLTVDC